MAKKSRLIEATKLTPLQEQFALQIVLTNNVTKAAEICGISQRTGHRWVDLPLVQAKIDELSQGAFDAAMHLLESMTIGAVKMLGHAMNAEYTPPQVRVRCAQLLIEYGMEAHKIRQFESRLTDLENRLQLYDIAQEDDEPERKKRRIVDANELDPL